MSYTPNSYSQCWREIALVPPVEQDRHGAFLDDREQVGWTKPVGFPALLQPDGYFAQDAPHGLEVVLVRAAGKPATPVVREAWTQRRAKRESPVLLVVQYPARGEAKVSLCGPAGEHPAVYHDVEVSQAERLAGVALGEPNRHAATRFLLAALPELESLMPGLRNVGLLASQELRVGVPLMAEWPDAAQRARSLLGLRGQGLVKGLGFGVEMLSTGTSILTVNGRNRAVAVFCDDDEPFDAPARRFAGASPISRGLADADRLGADWVVLTRAAEIRLYAARPDTGVGRKGRAETFVEANLSLLPAEFAGYLHVLFSADALAAGGLIEGILERSADFASDLAGRLRERVYFKTVPALASALARRLGHEATPSHLDAAYEQVMVILFRLLFVAYAEDKDLLPYRTNSHYADHSLKLRARRLTEDRRAARVDYDESATDLWDDVRQLWRAVDAGNSGWGVPAYDGGLFSHDPDVSPSGAALATLRLTDAEFAPALSALLVDEGHEGYGPVDFRLLSVREFGTIYEGLLESTLAVAQDDLAVRKVKGREHYVPAKPGEPVEVAAGAAYLHNRSGVRKATGSYFTKPFAVEHLLEHALKPALDDHIARLDALAATGDDAALSEAFFDFRCADISMGSAHFLVSGLDRIEARLSAWLAQHPVSGVSAELDRLRDTALDALGDLGVGVEVESTSLLRRQVARHCIYGVDRNRVAVELARLSIWVHTFVPGLPLSLLDHNLICGDSLTGVGTLDEAVAAIDPAVTPEEPSLFRDQIAGLLARAEDALHRLARTSDATKKEIDEARDAHRSAQTAVVDARAIFDVITAQRAGACEMPAHFDVATFVAMAKQPEVADKVRELRPVHFPADFPEVFLRGNPGFGCLLGNPPWEEATIEELGFWARRFPGLKALPPPKQREKIQEYRRQRPDLVAEYDIGVEQAARVRDLLHNGPFPGMSTADPDLYKAFAWRFWSLARSGGTIGIVLPRSIFTALGNTKWREAVIPNATTDVVFITNDGEWAFTDVNPGYGICFVTVTRSAGRDVPAGLAARGNYRSEAECREGLRRPPATLTASLLRKVDKNLCVPRVRSDRDFAILRKMYQHRPFGDGTRPDFFARPHTDFHATNDRNEHLLADANEYPVHNHRNIEHLLFDPDAGTFAYTQFDDAIAELDARRQKGRKHKRSPFHGMPSQSVQIWETLPALNPRLVFRDVVHASNTRKIWFALAPSGTILTNKAPYLIFHRGDLRAQAYVLGIMATAAIDWIGHLKVNLNLNYFILNGLPVPEHVEGDARCDRVAVLAAGLALAGDGDYGDWTTLADPIVADDARQDALSELEACGAALYGLDQDDIVTIVDSYPEKAGHASRGEAVLGHYHYWAQR